jgi:hypothetical protein
LVIGAEAGEEGAGSSATQTWEGWHSRRKIGRRKVNRSLSAEVVASLTEAWYFAARLGLNCNQFATIRPHDINSLTPPERQVRWQDILNKIAQFARDHDFEGVYIWSRESDPGTGTNEHLHVLTHIPPKLVRRFRETAFGWFSKAAEIDIKPANYRIRRTASGKQRSAIGYLTKNSPQAAYGRPREYRKGGPILGKRAGCSRNIDVSARAIWEARRAIRREFGIPTTHDHHGGVDAQALGDLSAPI